MSLDITSNEINCLKARKKQKKQMFGRNGTGVVRQEH